MIAAGRAPYRRGIHADMYRGRPWTIRQLSGAGSPEQVNERIKFLLNEGATGVNILFDVPTIQMYDSDEPESAGMVGVVGVPIDTVDDMTAVFSGIPIDEISVSIVSHYPSNTAILMGMYLAMAERRGVAWNKLRGSVQNDFIMEEVVRNGLEFIPPQACFELQCQNIAFLAENVPQWNAATFNGYNLREFGADMVLESAVALVNGCETLRKVPDAKVSFFWCIGSDFFGEIARLRAVRQVWYEMTRQKLRCHCQTSGISLTRAEPLNNIVRAGYQAMAAVLGGCQSLHVDSFDEAYAVPSEQSSLVSLRTQQIIQVETGVMDEPDPLGGSEYIERLTDDTYHRIKEAIDGLQDEGGIVRAVESGNLRRECVRGQRWQPKQVEAHGGEMDIQPLRPIEKAVKRCDYVHFEIRDGAMEDCIVAARSGATVGQMRRAILERWGRWQRS